MRGIDEALMLSKVYEADVLSKWGPKVAAGADERPSKVREGGRAALPCHLPSHPPYSPSLPPLRR